MQQLQVGGSTNNHVHGGRHNNPHRVEAAEESLSTAVRRSRGQSRMMISSARCQERDNFGAAGREIRWQRHHLCHHRQQQTGCDPSWSSL
jgi:hypothetical protein